jgi:hypothetical protein
MRRRLLLLALLTLAGCSQAPQPSTSTEGRVKQLEEQVEHERRASGTAGYAPKVVGDLDDLGVPVADLLKQLPGVVGVEVLVAAPKPAHRIIHLRDWHHVPRDRFALDARQPAGKHLADAEVDALYAQHLLEVELVQVEQAAILECLNRHHGLRRVLVEGLTPKGVAAYKVLQGGRHQEQVAQEDRAGEAGRPAGAAEVVEQAALRLAAGFAADDRQERPGGPALRVGEVVDVARPGRPRR